MPSSAHIDFAPSPFLFLAIVLALIGYTVWSYQKSPAPVSSAWRAVLAGLRTMTWLFLLLLLLQPVFHLTFQRREKPVLDVLIDISASMRTVDRAGMRSRILETLIHSDAFRAFQKRFSVRYFLFAGDVRRVQNPPEPLVPDGRISDLAGALEKNREGDADAALVFSDGIDNTGRNPLHGIEPDGCPVYSIAIGDPFEKPDLMISHVQTNERVYVQNRTPVRIQVRGPGFGGRSAELELQADGKVQDRTTVVLPADGMETSAELRFQFDSPGFRKLKIVLKPFSGESNPENNVREEMVQALKSKMKILLLADAPSPDLAFLKRILAEDPDAELQFRTLKSGSEFFEGPFPNDRELAGMDEFWLLDVPSRYFPDALWQKLASLLLRERKPFLLIAGNKLDLEKIGILGPKLPVRFGDIVPEQWVLPIIANEGRNHPLLRVEKVKDPGRIELPPVFYPWARVQPIPPGRILIEAVPEKTGESNAFRGPLLAVRSGGEQKSMVILARGIFRWELMTQSRPSSAGVFRTWIGNAVRWLGVREEDKPVRLSVSRSVLRAGEDVVFAVRAVDESVQPVEGADVMVRFAAPAGRQPVRLSDQGSGLYQAVFRPLQEGMYRAVAEASAEGQVLGKDTTEFSVSAFNPEMLDTRARPEVLSALAEKSGGRSGPPDSLAAVLDAMRMPMKTVERKTEWTFAFSPVMLGLVLLFLSAEWFIRRRKGMM